MEDEGCKGDIVGLYNEKPSHRAAGIVHHSYLYPPTGFETVNDPYAYVSFRITTIRICLPFWLVFIIIPIMRWLKKAQSIYVLSIARRQRFAILVYIDG